MMPFDREMLVNALRYNARAIAEGRVYIGMLPYPLCEDIGAVGLVGWVYAFQSQKGMSPDGKLDPETYDMLRTDEDTISLKIDPVSKRKID